MSTTGCVGAWMEVVDGMHAGQGQGGWPHVGRCRSVFEVRGDTLITPLSGCAALGRVEPELVGLPGKAFSRLDAHNGALV